MRRTLIQAVLILPGTALVYVPALIVWGTRDTPLAASPPDSGHLSCWIGAVLLILGLGLAIWTVRLFVVVGRGTPAPWQPPERLVVRGPYRHVRNPMILSVLIMLAGESLLLRSWPLAAWMLLVFAANAVYFPRVEEKELERRFGEAYRRYKANVPRWVPRLRPWRPDAM